MKTYLGFVATSTLLLVSVSTSGSDDFPRGNPYGEHRPYGRHPGIDFMVSVGTPVIAPADGKITEIRNFDGPRPWQGGFVVQLSHSEDFHSAYLHLRALHVEMEQFLKRGQLIGLSHTFTSVLAEPRDAASISRRRLTRINSGSEARRSALNRATIIRVTLNTN